MSEMSNEKQETVADIVSEKRREAQHIRNINDTPRGRREALDLDEEADRIEAAVEFTLAVETAKSAGEGFAAGEQSAKERSCKLGNAAAMREVLEQIANMGEQIDNQLGSSEETVYAFRNERCIAHNISECARAALSAPPRNCDVGTPKEQSARFDAHCRKHMGCLTCPLREKDGGVPKHCELAWSQMPYEEVK